ncbi:Mss4-like protein [Obelidium mucronatum]|nr:Mss4-like protein [Obelidium mucronatum]
MSDSLETKLICPVPGCGCVVLGKGNAVKDASFVLEPKVEFPALPISTSKTPTDSTTFKYLWKVADKMDFWNIAFSLVLPGSGGHRMLACADCEVGPIGFQPVGSETCFIIPDRVLVKE